MDLKGAVAVVTGGGTGIGRAVAVGLAQRGCNVVINYSRSQADANECAAVCRAHGVETLVVQADVAKDEDCRRMAQEAMDKWGRIDVLVNNAGITSYVNHADLEGLSAEDFQRIYGVNVIGAYQMVRACAPAMKASGNGAVVNVGSIAGIAGNGSSIAYAASKGALHTMTKSLARALGPEIRVNAVCPGLVDSRWGRDGMGDASYEKFAKHVEETVPLHKVSSPEDIAEVILWLIDGSSMVTGERLLIDGGAHLGFA